MTTVTRNAGPTNADAVCPECGAQEPDWHAGRAADAQAALPTPNTGEREALDGVVRAWGELPMGNYHPSIVERWLKQHMKPAIDEARRALKEKTDK